MYSRIITHPHDKSFFLFGPRGTGKSTWLRHNFPDDIYIDLLSGAIVRPLMAGPERLAEYIPEGYNGWVIIDEIQKIPELLNEVHRLIEQEGFRFILTGSSARSLRRKGVNLLAGRANQLFMHPLTSGELGDDFSFQHSIQYGFLPSVFTESDPRAYLQSYVFTYIEEEVREEGLTRNIGAFHRFLESASFSQAAPLNISSVARDCNVHRKVVEEYFNILEDLLMAIRIPVFTKRAARKMRSHPKFFFFDTGVYRIIRPSGPLDNPSEIGGHAMETLVMQQLRAINDYYNLGYTMYYWRTYNNIEVDLIMYGSKGIKAFEIKYSKKIKPSDLKGLHAFKNDYPESDLFMVYGGNELLYKSDIQVIPVNVFLERLLSILE